MGRSQTKPNPSFWSRAFVVCTLLGLTLGVATLFKIMYSEREEMILIFGLIGASMLLTGVGVVGLGTLLIKRVLNGRRVGSIGLNDPRDPTP